MCIYIYIYIGGPHDARLPGDAGGLRRHRRLRGLYNMILHYIVLYYTMLVYFVVACYIILYCITLYYIMLHYSA